MAAKRKRHGEKSADSAQQRHAEPHSHEHSKHSRRLKKRKRRHLAKAAALAKTETANSDRRDDDAHGQVVHHSALQPPLERPSPRSGILPLASGRMRMFEQSFSDQYGIQQARKPARMAARKAQSASASSVSAHHLDTSASLGVLPRSEPQVPILAFEVNLTGSAFVPEAVYPRYVRAGEGHALGHNVKLFGTGLTGDGLVDHGPEVGPELSETIVATPDPYQALPDTAWPLALSEEQKQLVHLIRKGNNVFYTGSAGTGKSTVLNEFVKDLGERGKIVVKVAPTGVAALNIDGQTYFTFMGWTHSSEHISIRALEASARLPGKRWKRMNEMDVLVIDEISMISNHQLSRIDRVLRSARQPSFRQRVGKIDRNLWTWMHGSPTLTGKQGLRMTQIFLLVDPRSSLPATSASFRQYCRSGHASLVVAGQKRPRTLWRDPRIRIGGASLAIQRFNCTTNGLSGAPRGKSVPSQPLS